VIAALLAAIPAISSFIGNLLQPGGAIAGVTSTLAKFSGQPVTSRKPLKLVKLKKFSLVKKPGFSTGQKVAIGVGAVAAAGAVGYGVTQLIRYIQKPNVPNQPAAAAAAAAAPEKLNLADPWWLRAAPGGPAGLAKAPPEVMNGIVIPAQGGVVQVVADQIAQALATLTPAYTKLSDVPGYYAGGRVDLGLIPQGSNLAYQGMLNGIPLVGSSTNPYDYMG